MKKSLKWLEKCRYCKELGDFELNLGKMIVNRIKYPEVCSGCLFEHENDNKLDDELASMIEGLPSEGYTNEVIDEDRKAAMLDKYIRLNLNYYRLNKLGMVKLRSLEKQWVECGFNLSNITFYKRYRKRVHMKDEAFYSGLKEEFIGKKRTYFNREV